MSNSLKTNAKSNCDELMTGLKDLGQHMSHKVAAAIATTMEHSNNLNQVTLQTILDILQNQSNVHTGAQSPSSFTSSNADQCPESGIPSGDRLAKGKARATEIHDSTKPPKPPNTSNTQSNGMFRVMTIDDNAEPPTPGPSKWPNTPMPTWLPPRTPTP
jgi:hypothetical protein